MIKTINFTLQRCWSIINFSHITRQVERQLKFKRAWSPSATRDVFASHISMSLMLASTACDGSHTTCVFSMIPYVITQPSSVNIQWKDNNRVLLACVKISSLININSSKYVNPGQISWFCGRRDEDSATLPAGWDIENELIGIEFKSSAAQQNIRTILYESHGASRDGRSNDCLNWLLRIMVNTFKVFTLPAR